MTIKWKSSEILKVFGTTIREGTFKGSKAHPNGSIVKDVPTTFTPATIARIYENISTHVPIYLGHDTNESSRKPIGYAYKFGVTENLDDIKYDGFVFDSKAINRIATEGWDKVSPEINEELTNLEAICFVPNPAISDTTADMEIKVFSVEAQTPSGMSEDTVVTAPTQTETPTSGVDKGVTSTPSAKESININVPPTNVDALVAQVEDYRSKYEQANAKIETLMTGQYKAVVSELKELGVDNPESMVRGLSTEQKISVLSGFKENIVTKKPLTDSPPSTPPDTTSGDSVLDEVLKEIGMSKEQYEEMQKKIRR